MNFTKYHVCTCDVIVCDERERADARALCSRHTGAGASALVTVKENPFAARFFRADGREVPVDASALLCAAAYLSERCGTPKITVLTRGGVCEAEILPRGDAKLTLPEINIAPVKLRRADVSPPTEYARIDFFGARAFCPTDDIWGAILFGLGEKMSNYRAFSGGADVDLAYAKEKDVIEVRSYERGAGYVTSASGALCATAAMRSLGMCGDDVSVAVDSGRMNVHLGKRPSVSASVTKIFRGEM